MSQFAQLLANHVEAPGTDNTGLKGVYDFVIEWTPDEAVSDSSIGPSLFTALWEQLGLQAHPSRVTAEEFVIEHVERATQN